MNFPPVMRVTKCIIIFCRRIFVQPCMGLEPTTFTSSVNYFEHLLEKITSFKPPDFIPFFLIFPIFPQYSYSKGGKCCRCLFFFTQGAGFFFSAYFHPCILQYEGKKYGNFYPAIIPRVMHIQHVSCTSHHQTE